MKLLLQSARLSTKLSTNSVVDGRVIRTLLRSLQSHIELLNFLNTYFKAPHDESHRVTTESGVQFRHLSKCSNTWVGACVRLRTDLVASTGASLRGAPTKDCNCPALALISSSPPTAPVTSGENDVPEPVVDVTADSIGDLGGVADE
jgi:hypothetical protein